VNTWWWLLALVVVVIVLMFVIEGLVRRARERARKESEARHERVAKRTTEEWHKAIAKKRDTDRLQKPESD
jgi:flagellar biosynthesis/type III secretory pathway M-ring protein FliF/YscJ